MHILYTGINIVWHTGIVLVVIYLRFLIHWFRHREIGGFGPPTYVQTPIAKPWWVYHVLCIIFRLFTVHQQRKFFQTPHFFGLVRPLSWSIIGWLLTKSIWKHMVDNQPSATFVRFILMLDHISSVCQKCYHQLRQIPRVRKSLSADSQLLLVLALVHSWLDFCNSVLHSLPWSRLQLLQSSVEFGSVIDS